METFVSDSNEALSFRLIRDETELKSIEAENGETVDAKIFSPEMSHQIYGDKENIFGYRGLKIELWMSAATLKAFVRMKAEETLSLEMSEGVSPDPVIPPLVKILAEDQVTENLNSFTAEILSEKETKFVPHGEKIAEFQAQPRDGGK